MVARTPHEPLRLADGTTVDPSGTATAPGKKFAAKDARKYAERLTKQQRERDLEEQRTKNALTSLTTRKTLSDLPLPPRRMHATGLVCLYTLFGLNNTDIAHALAITEPNVEAIKLTDAFTEVEQGIIENIRNSDKDDVQGILSTGSRKAAQRMLEFLDLDPKDDLYDANIVQSASKDILDRTGFRPADIVEHRHRLDGELVIEHIKRDDSLNPSIDVEFNEVNEHEHEGPSDGDSQGP